MREPTITRNDTAGGADDGSRDPDSTISTKAFVGSVGTALTVLMLLLLTTVGMNAVSGAFAPGIGGFNATFGTLNYNDTTAGVGHPQAHIYPTKTVDTAACQGQPNATDTGDAHIPALTADVPGTVSVKGLYLKKTIPTPDAVVYDPINNVTLNITAATNTAINLDDPTLLFNSLEADQLDLSGGVAIYENHSNGSAAAPYLGRTGEFHINATNLEVQSATAWAHLVAFQSISLPNQELSLEFNTPNTMTADDVCNAV